VSAIARAEGASLTTRTSRRRSCSFTLTYDVSRIDGAITDTPTVFTALPEQLGLKLQPACAAVDTLVIDRIARPTEN